MEAKTLLAQVVLAALTVGGAAAAEATEDIDGSQIVRALEDELGSWKREMRARVLGVVAQDPRPEVRAAAAKHLVDLGLPLSRPARRVIRQLAVDSDGGVRREVVRSVRDLCMSSAPLEASHLLDTWGVGRSQPMRNLTAEVVSDEHYTNSLPSALESLAGYHDPEVRRSAARTAAARARYEGPIYRDILVGLTEDPDPDTASLSQRLLSDLDE